MMTPHAAHVMLGTVYQVATQFAFDSPDGMTILKAHVNDPPST